LTYEPESNRASTCFFDIDLDIEDFIHLNLLFLSMEVTRVHVIMNYMVENIFIYI